MCHDSPNLPVHEARSDLHVSSSCSVAAAAGRHVSWRYLRMKQSNI